MKVTSWDEISHFCTLRFGDLDLICLINKGTSKSLCVCPWLASIWLEVGRAFLSPTCSLSLIIVQMETRCLNVQCALVLRSPLCDVFGHSTPFISGLSVDIPLVFSIHLRPSVTQSGTCYGLVLGPGTPSYRRYSMSQPMCFPLS